MSKKLMICLTAVTFVFSLALAGGMAVAADTGPATMVLKAEKGTKPANFNHKKHQEANKCTACHHKKDANGAQVPIAEGDTIEKCATCHNAEVMGSNRKLNSFKAVAHTRCKGCHKKTGGPTKCKACHPKKKK